MVDGIGEYVLQWDGHARHITERFSGLLARQSLVDVTLICEEQRLRVHKLVLASCSLYFEEMLEQDLGQEPTILLNDLNFDVLKAMVEFMYCGETSISKDNLEALLMAAEVFKVKELACIARTMMGPLCDVEDQVGNTCTDEFPDEDTDDLPEENDRSLFSDNDRISISRSNSIGSDECSENECSENESAQAADDKLGSNCLTDNDTIEELEPSLYADKNHLRKHDIDVRNIVVSYKNKSTVKNTFDENFEINGEVIDTDSCTRDDIEPPADDDRNDIQPVLYEYCCDFVNNETNLSECVEIPLLEADCDDVIHGTGEFGMINRTVDKSLRVYTHKRRKFIDGVDKQFVKLTENLPESANGDCIDLIEEPSRDETELKSEYIVTMSPKNVETVIDFCNVVNDTSEERDSSNVNVNITALPNKQARQMKEIFTNEQSEGVLFRSNSAQCAPTLRRSVRLSQHESEDTTSGENPLKELDKRKDLRKGSLMMNKRKNNRDIDYRESDENKESLRKSLDVRRSVRCNNGGKFNAPRGSSKACLSLSKSMRRKEGNVISNGKLNKSEKLQMIRPEWCESFSTKFNTIATVSRALWGDMSDCLENSENNVAALEYSPSKEIPFAVGLLPLRAALERMQAMPDYQPRKTRSSAMTPFRQEFNGAKRKNCWNNGDSNNSNAKRQNQGSVHSSGEDNLNAGGTVCHVRITASSHSQPHVVRPRRKLLDEEITATISTTNIVNRQ